MAIDTKLKMKAFKIGVPVATAIGLFLGYSSFSHRDLSYDTGSTQVVQMRDGAFSHTEAVKDKSTGSVSINHKDILRSESYLDSNGDGLVDEISMVSHFSRGNNYVDLNRSKDLTKFKGVFENADTSFGQNMVRFKPYLTK